MRALSLLALFGISILCHGCAEDAPTEDESLRKKNEEAAAALSSPDTQKFVDALRTRTLILKSLYHEWELLAGPQSQMDDFSVRVLASQEIDVSATRESIDQFVEDWPALEPYYKELVELQDQPKSVRVQELAAQIEGLRQRALLSGPEDEPVVELYALGSAAQALYERADKEPLDAFTKKLDIIKRMNEIESIPLTDGR